MATDKALLSKWYDALYSEDSLKVKSLLAAHPSLLKVGWGDGASQFESRGDWKQRTALHVGVKRGNAELVEQVLKLCKVLFRKHSTKEEEDDGRRTDELGQDEREDAQKNEISNTSVGFQNPVPNISRSDPDEIDAISREIAGRVVAHWKRKGDLTGLAKVKFSFAIAVRRLKRDADETSREIAQLVVAKWKRLVDDSRFLRNPKVSKTFLKGLLEFKDEMYELNATATAVLHGNRKIILLLLHASQQSGQFFKALLPALDATAESQEDMADRAKLRGATELLVRASSGEPVSQWLQCLRLYRKDVNFNFLPWQEYLFHFLLSSGLPKDLGIREWAADFARDLWAAVMSCSDSTWRFLLRLQDGQGRTPLSAAVAGSGFGTKKILHIFASAGGKVGEEVADHAMAAPDGAGRTAMHVALALGRGGPIRNLVGFWGDAKKIEKLVCERWRHPIPAVVDVWTGESKHFVLKLSRSHGSNASTASEFTFDTAEGRSMWTVEATPLQSAIMFRKIGALMGSLTNPVRNLVDDNQEEEDRANFGSWYNRRGLFRFQGKKNERSKLLKDWGLGNVFRRRCGISTGLGVRSFPQYAFHGVELAAFVGDTRRATLLPMGEYNLNSKLHSSRTKFECPWPALHIAANNANYDMLKGILDDPTCDPYLEDWDGNTALHHALKVVRIIEFGTHLLDYVSPEHFNGREPKIVGKETSDDNSLSQRKGCINLLLQVGCDIFRTNKRKQPPYPGGELRSNSEFLSWWYARQPKAFELTQSTLRSAATAISVTATLVATASYVGPLQPPMGFAGDPSQIQDPNLWVRIFIFCDTMSFYLAIAAITLSLIPSIPVPQQQMKDEVQRTQFMVTMAVIILFPSIIFVLVAFIASSIAVVSANPASTGGSLTFFTASIGGLFCLLTFTLFSLRLAAFLFPKSKLIRRMYNATNWSLSS